MEVQDQRGRRGGSLSFEVVYRNVTDAPLVVGAALTKGEPLGGSRFLRDGEPVDPPDACFVDSIAQGEGFLLQLLPGGTLTVPASVPLRPGGDGVWLGERGCDGSLPPGEYVFELQAPDGSYHRRDPVPVVVER